MTGFILGNLKTEWKSSWKAHANTTQRPYHAPHTYASFRSVGLGGKDNTGKCAVKVGSAAVSLGESQG